MQQFSPSSQTLPSHRWPSGILLTSVNHERPDCESFLWTLEGHPSASRALSLVLAKRYLTSAHCVSGTVFVKVEGCRTPLFNRTLAFMGLGDRKNKLFWEPAIFRRLHVTPKCPKPSLAWNSAGSAGSRTELTSLQSHCGSWATNALTPGNALRSACGVGRRNTRNRIQSPIFKDSTME